MQDTQQTFLLRVTPSRRDKGPCNRAELYQILKRCILPYYTTEKFAEQLRSLGHHRRIRCVNPVPGLQEKYDRIEEELPFDEADIAQVLREHSAHVVTKGK